MRLAPLLFLALSACATGSPVAVCPEPIVYSPEDQKAARAELAAVPEPCVLCRFMADYAQERAKLRECQ